MSSRRQRITTFLLAVLLISQANLVYPKQGTIKQCRKVEKKIEHYTKLRRSGGSASQMDAWHRRRAKQKEKWSKLNCNNTR
jgi:cell division protein FtsB